MKIASSAAVRAAEQQLFAQGRISSLQLMDRVIARLVELFRPGRSELADFHPEHIIVAAGKGNNAGDAIGLAAALRLPVTLLSTCPPDQLSPDTRAQLARIPAELLNRQAPEPRPNTLLIDGLLGSGASGPLREPIRSLARQLNRLRTASPRSFTLAIDIPTGLDADTGRPDPDAIRADISCPIGCVKPGMLRDGAEQCVGRLLPIPHMPPPINFERALAGNGKSITIAYLGGAREEKGFQCLSGLIQALSQKEHQKTLHYMIQTSGIEILSTEYERRIMSETLAQLKKEKTAQVDLVGSMRESSDYYKMLENTDIVLLPYINIVPKRYYATSGILAEAMALGKVAVVPAETWLARQIERSGGGVIFDSPEELPQKVEEAICNYSDLQEKALQYSGIWRQFNNLDTYLTVLMEYFLPQVKTPLSTRSSNEN